MVHQVGGLSGGDRDSDSSKAYLVSYFFDHLKAFSGARFLILRRKEATVAFAEVS